MIFIPSGFQIITLCGTLIVLVDPDANHDSDPQPEPEKTGPKFYGAMAGYAIIALLATFTLDGKFRLAVWLFLGLLAIKTYLATLRKP